MSGALSDCPESDAPPEPLSQGEAAGAGHSRGQHCLFGHSLGNHSNGPASMVASLLNPESKGGWGLGVGGLGGLRAVKNRLGLEVCPSSRVEVPLGPGHVPMIEHSELAPHKKPLQTTGQKTRKAPRPPKVPKGAPRQTWRRQAQTSAILTKKAESATSHWTVGDGTLSDTERLVLHETPAEDVPDFCLTSEAQRAKRQEARRFAMVGTMKRYDQLLGNVAGHSGHLLLLWGKLGLPLLSKDKNHLVTLSPVCEWPTPHRDLQAHLNLVSHHPTCDDFSGLKSSDWHGGSRFICVPSTGHFPEIWRPQAGGCTPRAALARPPPQRKTKELELNLHP